MSNYPINENTFKSVIRDANSNEARPYTTDRGLNRSIDNISLSNLKFERTETYENPIVLNKCIFKQIDFDGATFKKFIWFKNCVLEDDVRFYDGTFESIIFDNCQFTTGLTIYNINIDRLSFDNCSSKNHFKIKGGIFSSLRYISNDEKTHLIINGHFTFINFFDLSAAIGATVSISNSIINLLKIEGDFNSASRINFKEISNKDLSLTNVNNDGKFYITNFKIRHSQLSLIHDLQWFVEIINDEDLKREIKLTLRNKPHINTFFQLYNDITLNQDAKNFLYHVFSSTVIKIIYDNLNKPQLVMQYSSLGIFEMKSMRVDEYETLIISSDLSSLKLINTTFSTELRAFTNSDGFSMYTDFYSSANKQNNSSDKVEYYKAAQRYLYKKIKAQPKSIQRTGSLSALIISDFYSHHGSNWIRAALRTVFLISFPSFLLFTASLKDLSLDLSVKGINYYMEDILQYFPEFLNPLHRIDFMSLISPNGVMSSLFDLIGRIFIGIGIFEMVRSFRKYVRT